MNKQLEDIKLIRDMMERSSKFISLSGLSGILAGITALIGTGLGMYILQTGNTFNPFNLAPGQYSVLTYDWIQIVDLVLIAILVLCISVGVGLFFSIRKARRINQNILNKTSLRVLYNLSIPLVTGGILCCMLILMGKITIPVAMTLIFYGLALINVSKFTYDEIHYLGLTEIVLGLGAMATRFVDDGANSLMYALIFWGIGFGVCHIIYGTTMYIKYDMKK